MGASNDLFVYNADRRIWGRPSATGTPPSPRHEHVGVMVGRKLFIHGGLTGDAAILGDLHVLDTEFMLWFNEPPTSGPAPGQIHGHSAVLYENRIYMFGGHTPSGSINQLSILDTQLMTWHVAPVTRSTPPHPRAGHAAVML